jgi:FMN phosphatase YigB (HAD superfamily)
VTRNRPDRTVTTTWWSPFTGPDVSTSTPQYLQDRRHGGPAECAELAGPDVRHVGAVPVAGVSNFDALLTAILERLDLSRWFPVVVTSREVGLYKPDPRIFQYALQRLDVSPESALFVGDSPYSDIGGASAAGITPVLLDRVGAHPTCDATTITQLGELVGLLA